jgi:BirA family biotin operon repressor/biotin-[acetyl-CoA-carboxylase] ligase
MSTVVAEDPVLQSLLTLLADGESHSGQELGEALGMSRAAVWKQLQKLELLGLELQSVKGKGYRLEGGLELLSADVIKQQLSSEAEKLLKQLDVFFTIDSTNAEALRNVHRGSGYACTAELQTAGRGRRGRGWVSPFAKNIYLSLGWTFNGGAPQLEGLSLAVGVVIADVLNAFGLDDVQLKWPNDVLWREQKLAGVLLEMTGDVAGVCHVVVGVGLNVAMPVNAATAIGQPWTDIQTMLHGTAASKSVGRNALISELLSQLLPLLRDYPAHRFAAYRSRWEALNAHAGKIVELQTANSIINGVLLGVNNAGALRLLTQNEEQVFYGGEVTVRAAS